MLNKITEIKVFVLIHLIKWLKGYGSIDTKAIFAQAVHETGRFTSKVYKENKNLFGMRHPSKRKTYSEGSNLGHAVFKSHLDSIRDYFERQSEFEITDKSTEDFMTETVASGYAEDRSYLMKWQNLYNQQKSPIPKWLKWLVIGLVVIVFLSLLKGKK